MKRNREGGFEDLRPAAQRASRSGGPFGKHEAKPSAEKGKVWIEVWVGVWIEVRLAGNSNSLHNHPISPPGKGDTVFDVPSEIIGSGRVDRAIVGKVGSAFSVSVGSR